MRAALSQLALVWATILLLGTVGCSSGGGSSDESSFADVEAAAAPPPDSHISGTATKGVLNNATISVYAVENGVRTDLITSRAIFKLPGSQREETADS